MESVMLNDRYRLLELIGSGGMAVVYRGVDTLLQRQVAIKVLRESFAGDPAFLARFQREARAAAGLDHPNVVTVYDVGQDGDRHYIVMEHVDGQDLKTLIRQRGRLSVAEALSIAIQMSAGVGHAHKAGVIHCDIKPQNVLVTQDGQARVTDFGIARALSESGLTESETVWGSPLYFSPEQAAGDPPSPASDVYSIGVVMYEMLAGLPPFQAEKPAALALMHMREEPSPLAVHNPQVPPQLDWIIRKLLAKEPAARYRNAEQVAHVLDEYRRHGEQVTGWQPVAPVRTPTPIRVAETQPPPEAQAGFDKLTWVLAAIAFFAVMGLLVLWGGFVVPAYSSQPGPVSTRTPTPLITLTPEVQLVPVPDVVGEPMDEAQKTVERAGLRFVVLEERDEAGVEGGIVLEQSPAPGERAPLDSEVSVVVNKLGRELTMPDVLGYELETVREGLESNGLHIVTEQVWSTQPEGLVLSQVPESGATVRVGDTVTLTVSGGVDILIPLEVNLADQVMLKSAELRQKTFRPGGVIAVTLRWRALRSIEANYRVFVHLQDLNGPHSAPVAHGDADPIIPISRWRPGEEVVDPHQVKVPDDLPAGRYQLRVGMYSPGSGSRLSVVDAGFTTAELDSILVAEIEVRP
jgi:predicted Ser/Thr protein kinase